MRTIILVGYDNAQILDITGPAQVFASAGEAARAPAYRVILAGADGDQVTTTAGLSLGAVPLDQVDPAGADTILVSGGHGVEQAARNPALIGWMKQAAAGARRIGSICSGTFVLAAAGLLDGRRAATHWSVAKQLQTLFPAIKVDADALFVTDGAFWTSAGVTAGIDMALAMVEADMGRDIAMTVARQLVVYARRPGNQSQFSALLKGQARASGTFGASITWMAQNLDKAITVTDVAEQAGMSERSFHRHFADATGETPARYLERLRLDAARHLLESPHLPLKSVAAQAGFGTPGRLIQVFERKLGLSPTAYRHLHGRR